MLPTRCHTGCRPTAKASSCTSSRSSCSHTLIDVGDHSDHRGLRGGVLSEVKQLVLRGTTRPLAMEYRSPRAAFHELELPARIPGLAEQLDIALGHEQSRGSSAVERAGDASFPGCVHAPLRQLVPGAARDSLARSPAGLMASPRERRMLSSAYSQRAVKSEAMRLLQPGLYQQERWTASDGCGVECGAVMGDAGLHALAGRVHIWVVHRVAQLCVVRAIT